MNVTVDADEDLLDEIFGFLAIADRSVDEVEKPRLIPLHELLERALLATKEGGHDCRVVFRSEPFSDFRSGERRALDCDLSHCHAPLGNCTRVRSDRTESIWAPPFWYAMSDRKSSPHEKAGRMPLERPQVTTC